MSLLTEEQIAELIGIASNQSTSKDLYDEFHEWNGKQTLAPQKREPAQTAREMYQRGYAKAKDDLKREPLTVLEKVK
jgi:hypothetical protein